MVIMLFDAAATAKDGVLYIYAFGMPEWGSKRRQGDRFFDTRDFDGVKPPE
jgi:hypothetical protein